MSLQHIQGEDIWGQTLYSGNNGESGCSWRIRVLSSWCVSIFFRENCWIMNFVSRYCIQILVKYLMHLFTISLYFFLLIRIVPKLCSWSLLCTLVCISIDAHRHNNTSSFTIEVLAYSVSLLPWSPKSAELIIFLVSSTSRPKSIWHQNKLSWKWWKMERN